MTSEIYTNVNEKTKQIFVIIIGKWKTYSLKWFTHGRLLLFPGIIEYIWKTRIFGKTLNFQRKYANNKLM